MSISFENLVSTADCLGYGYSVVHLLTVAKDSWHVDMYTLFAQRSLWAVETASPFTQPRSYFWQRVATAQAGGEEVQGSRWEELQIKS